MDSPTLLKYRAKPANMRTTTTIATILRADGDFLDLQFSIPEEDDQHSDHNSSTDSTDDLFFNATTPSSSSSSKFPSSLLKSATKIRIFLLRFKKSPNSKKIKMEEIFYRDHASSRSSNSSCSTKSSSEESMTSPSPASKVHKYLNKIKPLSFYNYKPRFSSSGNLSASSSCSSTKRLRKSRSASFAVAAVRSSPPRQPEEDGIQSAIAHCKRSFSGKDVVLARCRSDPGF